MRREILSRIHDDGHLSLQKSRQRMQESVWWPTVGQDLKEWIEKCSFCQHNSRQQHAEPLRPSVLPERPWTKIRMDLCLIEGKEYLVMIDYFSRWIEIKNLEDTTSSTLVRKVKTIFARWSIPEVIRSDNGPQFMSTIFKEFAFEYVFSHKTSDPYYPQGNEAAERAVQTAKRVLKQGDPSLALMTYQATVIEATGCSPAQLMMGRNIRTPLPAMKNQLCPRWPDLVKVAERDAEAKAKNACNYNVRHGARGLQPMQLGQEVLVQNPREGKWGSTPTKVKGTAGNRTCLIRKRCHLKHFMRGTPEKSMGGANMMVPMPRNLEQFDSEPAGLQERQGVCGSPGPVLRTRSGMAIKKVECLSL